MDPPTKGKISSLIGIVLSAVFRAINSFKPGNFIKMENHFGRVIERGLFHTEIQTENRDLTTIPGSGLN